MASFHEEVRFLIYMASSKSKALNKVSGKRKPFYTRADGSPETKKQYYARHYSDLSKYENS